MGFMHNIFLDKAHFGAYLEGSLHNQLSHRPHFSKLVLQYMAHAT